MGSIRGSVRKSLTGRLDSTGGSSSSSTLVPKLFRDVLGKKHVELCLEADGQQEFSLSFSAGVTRPVYPTRLYWLSHFRPTLISVHFSKHTVI